MDPNSGRVVEVKPDEKPPVGYVPFHVDEIVQIKGCYFRVKRFNQKKVTLKPIPKPVDTE